MSEELNFDPIWEQDTITEGVDESGGTVALPSGNASINIPANALKATKSISIGASEAAIPANYVAASGMYEFGPDGTEFDEPVEITMAFEGTPNKPVIYWSKRGNPNEFESVGGTVDQVEGTITASVTHFSNGFVAEETKRTTLKKSQIRDKNIQKRHIDKETAGEALITNVVNSDGITMAQTGADAGTGEVTLSVNTGAGVTIDEGQVTIAEGGITSGMLDPDVAGAGINHNDVNGLYLTGGDGIEIVENEGEDDIITVKLSDGLTIDEAGDITVKLADDTIVKDVNGIKVGAGSLDDSHIAEGACIDTSKLAEGEFFIKSDGTVAMAADLNLGDNKITNLANPELANDAANKYYVDTVAQGLTIKDAVTVATTEELVGVTYTDGPVESPGVGATLTGAAEALVIDGVSLDVGDRVLVKDQDGFEEQNGIYVVTTVGGVGTPWVLTRADDFDNHPTGEVFAGVFTFVGWGDVNKSFGFVMTKPNTHVPTDITIGTSKLHFTQFSGAGQLTAGPGIEIEGQTISVLTSEGVTIDGEGNVTLLLADNSLVQDVNGVSVNLGRGLTLDEVEGVSISEEFQTVDKFVLNEYHVIDAAGYTVTLNNTPREDSPQYLAVFLNGVMQYGEGNDYSVDGATITFTDQLNTYDLVSAIYVKEDTVA